MAYLKMKEKIAKLYSQLDNFNVNSNQQRKKYFYNIPVSNERIKHYDSILLQGKNNSFRTTNSNSKIKNDKKILFKSKSIFDFNNDENLIFNRKNHINQNFQKKYNELKSFTNDFNPNSFDLPSKESNLKRNKSSYFNVLGSVQNYKNDKKLSKKDLDLINESWQDAFDTSSYYIRSFVGANGVPQTDGLQAGKEIVPGYPTGPYNTYNYKLIPVYEVEWIKTDKQHVMRRYKTVRIGESIFILYGEDEDVIRSQSNPSRCTLSVNGVYFTNRSSEPFSLVLACASLQDKYNLLHFYRDNLIASSGNVGDWVDVSMLPKFLGVNLPERLQKFLAYKKSGIAPIDTSQEGRLGAGQAPMNTIFNGYDDTIKAQTVQAIQIAIDSVEQTASSITGVFRERLNGIQQKDAVTNVQTSVNNSFTITKPYYQQMDVVVEEMLLDALNLAKIVFKNGLQGTIILGDKYQRIFTALPEHFTISDHDIHVVTSSDITRQLEWLKQIVPDLVKSQLVGPELIIDAITTKSLTDYRGKVQKAIKRQKEEVGQMQQLQQQNEQMQQELQQIQKQAQQLQSKVEQLNEAKIQLEAQKAQMENEVAWYKAKTERAYRESVAEQDAKRTEIEYLQLHDGNPYNDKVVNART